MELILLQDVEKVGRKGDLVRVRDGFARNVLIPKKLALETTKENKKFVDEQRERAKKRQEIEKKKASEKAAQLAKIKLVLRAKAGEQGKLFGSITTADIADALKQQGHETDKKHVHLGSPIRALGEYTVQVELCPEVKAPVLVEVVAES